MENGVLDKKFIDCRKMDETDRKMDDDREKESERVSKKKRK